MIKKRYFILRSPVDDFLLFTTRDALKFYLYDQLQSIYSEEITDLDLTHRLAKYKVAEIEEGIRLINFRDASSYFKVTRSKWTLESI